MNDPIVTDPGDYHVLMADAARAHSEKLGRLLEYIEVGVLTGNSASALLGTGKIKYAVLIDKFPPEYAGYGSSKEIVERNLVEYWGLFDVRVGDSKLILPTIIEKFDIGFVDGDHSAEGCRTDMKNMLPLLREDGIMFVHDLQNPGHMYLKEVVEHFARDNNLRMTYHAHVHNALGELTR